MLNKNNKECYALTTEPDQENFSSVSESFSDDKRISEIASLITRNQNH